MPNKNTDAYWNDIPGLERGTVVDDLVLGDRENGVTRLMEYGAYDTGEEQYFQFGGKVRILTSEHKTCEWLQPTCLVKELLSGVILLESIYSCTLENFRELLSRSSRLSDHEREAVEFL
jgi:hypothetical protein